MTIESYSMHLEGWLHRYVEGDQSVQSLYDYRPAGDEKARLEELKSQTFERVKLRDALQTYHESFLYTEQSMKQIAKLQEPESVVVVGGQQAGLFTGPIFTIAKAMTIIRKARLEEERLGVPVIPVFWIAGEDHDVEEVNHIYVHANDEHIRKVKYEGKTVNGAAVTEQKFDTAALERMIEELFRQLGETMYTAELHEKIGILAGRAKTFSHFFAELMLWLFKDEGLVLIDPQETMFRKLMGRTWEQLLMNNDDVRESFHSAEKQLAKLNEEPFIQLSAGHSHIFYKDEQYREKLIAQPDGDLSLNDGRLKMSKAKWAEKAVLHPELFSSNVFTRPFVQERLLPVLHFISGPGELLYWSMLKPLFHRFDRYVPPVVPRLQQSFIDRKSEKVLKRAKLSPMDITMRGTHTHRKDLKEQNQQIESEPLFQQGLTIAADGQRLLKHALMELSPSEERYADQKYKQLKRLFEDMQHRVDDVQMKRIEPELKQLEHLGDRLRPQGKPQERVLNIMQVLNEAGEDRVRSIFKGIAFEEYQHQFYYL